MVPPTSQAPQSGEPVRPAGVGLTALALGVLISSELIQSLLPLVGKTHATLLAPDQLLLCGAQAIELFLIWQYWGGREFARLFVLLWSLLAVARSIAFLADHNLDPAALMSHPLSFLQALLALFLLYWLNTPPLRAWFKKISATEADLIADRLVGKLCTALDFGSSAANSHPAWRLTFEHGAELTLTCPFRIVLDDNLAFAYAPAAGSAHAPAAGSGALPHETSVPDPSSDPDDARRLLQNLRVTAVHLAPHTSDLFLTFEMGIQLQTWNPAPAPAPAAGSGALPPAPAAGSGALPPAPAAGSGALPPAPAAGSGALPPAPAAGSGALPPAPAAGSGALPHTNTFSPSPLWSFSDPGLTVIANAEGLSSQLAAASAEPPANDERS